VSRRSTGSHKAGRPGSIPGPATGLILAAGGPAPSGASYAPTARCDTRTGHFERPSTQTPAKRPGREPGDSVGSTPTSVTDDPVVQRRRHLRDMQETMVQFHPGSFDRSAGVSAAHVLGTDEGRVRFPSGPFADTNWAARPMGRYLVCTQEIGVQIPGRSTGRMRGSWSNGRQLRPPTDEGG
jgi:hypothetical protein